jgi:class 3 adenylate cyclase
MPELPSPPERERGFLLIADMESSTESKFVLGDEDAFGALREHNRLIMDRCRKAAPVEGVVLNSLGDAVVVKFPAEGADALASCLRAAREIVAGFEGLQPIRTPKGGEFRLRTKLTLQVYDAFRYGRRDAGATLAEELVGPDIDLAFRLSAVSWRLQVLVSEAFAAELLSRSLDPSADDPAAHGLEPRALLNRAHIARHFGALRPGPLEGLSEHFRLEHAGGSLDYWVTDAREIARLKGIGGAQSTYALSFESPESLLARGEGQRLTIKVKQDHHAVILASITHGRDRNDSYLEHVVQMLRDSADGDRLDSELTLCVAAKIYGEFDFFFRVSCIDDRSLRRFFEAIHDDEFGVSHVEVRSTLMDRFAVSRHYDSILARFEERPYELVLAWFERNPERDLYETLRAIMDEPAPRPVEILEVGEVIHHTPVYAIFICESLRDYAAFFGEHGLQPTACRSHIGHIGEPGDAQLRYSLMNGVYAPRRR